LGFIAMSFRLVTGLKGEEPKQELEMSPKTTEKIVTPGRGLTAAVFTSGRTGDRLESLAALWARQTGRPIRVAAPR
jgi:hypothetical protein